MANELATREDAPALNLAEMWRSLTELATNPDVDPQKMAALVDLQERMIDRTAAQEFHRAMHNARSKMPRIRKDGAITNKQGSVQSRFATYEAIDKIVRPIIEAEGLTYGFDYNEGEQGRLLVTCIVSHTGGHSERFGPMPLAIDQSGAKNPTQGAGSSGSYGQRYTLCAAFNIVTEGADTDGGAPVRDAAPNLPGLDPAELLDAAQVAATKGSESYAMWYKSRSNMERGWLMDGGHHARLKEAAAQCD
jgi:hypothetical protein